MSKVQAILNDAAISLLNKSKREIDMCKDAKTKSDMYNYAVRRFLDSTKSYDDMSSQEKLDFDNSIIEYFIFRGWVKL